MSRLLFPILLVLSGCAQPSLVGQMKARGVTYLNTKKVVIRDCEGGFGGNVVVSATEQFIIQEIWDRIYLSRPYHCWAACGWGEIEFYLSEDANTPAVVLEVNETDETHLKGKTPDQGFRCPGLQEYIDQFLRY